MSYSSHIDAAHTQGEKMNAFNVKNISGTINMTVWAQSNHHACMIVFEITKSSRSKLMPTQINGHGKKF